MNRTWPRPARAGRHRKLGWSTLSLAMAMSLGLGACGGGGGSGGDVTGDGGGGSGGGGGETPATLVLTAGPASSSTIALHWTGIAGATGYRLERRLGTGAWTSAAALPPAARMYLDDGLAASTAYTYRLVADGVAATSDEHAASTSDRQALVTAEGVVSGAATQAAVEGDGAQAWLPSGASVSVAAGALPAGGTVSLQTLSGTAPDALGDGVLVGFSSTPAEAPRLLVPYPASADEDVDTLGAALQRADGSWWALPVLGRDTAAHTLDVRLPPELGGATAPTAAGRERPHAGYEDRSEFRVVSYRQSYLSPATATIETGATLTLVPYTHTVGTAGNYCVPTSLDPDCLIPTPIVETREIPILNDKEGYARSWFVEDQPGGSPGLGFITPGSGAGAVYQAPVDEPTPNPVTVRFVSRQVATGRSVTLKSRVRVAAPVWTGSFDGTMEGAADLGFATHAQGIWTSMAGSGGGRFEATGTQALEVINIVCTASASPSSAPLPPGALVIDPSVDPPRYTLDAGSVWTSMISGTCPGQGWGQGAMSVPGQLQIDGEVADEGRRIEGAAVMNGVRWTWSLHKQLP